MATPSIKLDQTGQSAGTAGQSRSDIVVGSEMQITDTANASGTWVWVVVVPNNSSATATGLDSNDVRITPDIEGTYLFYVTHNGVETSYTLDAIGQKVTTQGGASARFPSGRRIPGAGETNQFGGWDDALESILRENTLLKEEDTPVAGGPFTTLNFKSVGGGTVDVVDAGAGEATVTISGGGSGGGVTFQDEGGSLAGSPHDTLNFVGTGVLSSDAGGGVVTVTIPGATASGIDTISCAHSASHGSATPLGVGQFELNPNDYDVDAVFTFRSVGAVGTTPLTGHTRLFNLTDAETVSTLNFTTATPTLDQEVLTVGTASGTLKTSSKIYEVRIYVDSPVGVDDTIELGSAEIRVIQ